MAKSKKTSRSKTSSPATDPAGDVLRTQSAIAKCMGVSSRTVRTWIDEGLPKPPIARQVAEVWCAAHRRGDRTDRRPQDAAKAELQLEKLRAETEIKQNEAAQVRREVVTVAEVLGTLLPYHHAARALLENLPDRLLPLIKLPPKQFRTKAAAAIEDVCQQLADAASDLSTLTKQPAVSREKHDPPDRPPKRGTRKRRS